MFIRYFHSEYLSKQYSIISTIYEYEDKDRNIAILILCLCFISMCKLPRTTDRHRLKCGLYVVCQWCAGVTNLNEDHLEAKIHKKLWWIFIITQAKSQDYKQGNIWRYIHFTIFCDNKHILRGRHPRLGLFSSFFMAHHSLFITVRLLSSRMSLLCTGLTSQPRPGCSLVYKYSI